MGRPTIDQWRPYGSHLAALSFYHWAHCSRYTLYDGLQLYHLNELIAVLTYGSATALTVLVGYILLFAA